VGIQGVSRRGYTVDMWRATNKSRRKIQSSLAPTSNMPIASAVKKRRTHLTVFIQRRPKEWYTDELAALTRKKTMTRRKSRRKERGGGGGELARSHVVR